MRTNYPNKPQELNWWKWLSDWKKYDETERVRLRGEAQFFDLCVTSECPSELLFPEDRSFKTLGYEVNGEQIPKDEILRELSVRFYRALMSSRVSKAQEVLKSIHKRTRQLLKKTK